MKTSQYLDTFLKFSRQVKSDYDYYYNSVGDLDEATQDVMHQLELGDYKDRGKFATKLSHIRKERRQHKDYVDVLSPLYKFFKDDPNWRACEKKLIEVLGQVRKQENYVEGQRAYRPRSLNNLTINLIDEDS